MLNRFRESRFRTKEASYTNFYYCFLLRTQWDDETRCLRRKDLIDNLYDALPPGTVKFGYQPESIKLDPHSTKPVLRFIDGSSIITKAVIGCDGGKSMVANFLNLKPTKMFPLCAVRGLTNYPNGHSFDHEFARFRKDNTLVERVSINDNLVFCFCVQPYIPKGGSAGLEDSVVLARTMARLGLNNVESGNKMTVHGVEEAFNRFVKQQRMRVVRFFVANLPHQHANGFFVVSKEVYLYYVTNG